MLHFLQNFTYYLMCEVVEPNWHAFEQTLRDAQSVDELIDAHERFLDACMKEGMLFWPRILRALERIKNVCLRFCGLSETLEKELPRRGCFRENLRAGRLSVNRYTQLYRTTFQMNYGGPALIVTLSVADACAAGKR